MRRLSLPHISLPTPQHFRDEVDIEAENLLRLAEPLFSRFDNGNSDTETKKLIQDAKPLFSSSPKEDSQIWAYLLKHLKQTAHCGVSKLWVDHTIHWGIRPIALLIAAVLLVCTVINQHGSKNARISAIHPDTLILVAYSQTTQKSTPDNITADINQALILSVSYLFVLAISYQLNIILHRWEKPYGQTIHSTRAIIALSLCLSAAFIPQILLQIAIYRHYHLSSVLKTRVGQLLTFGTSVALIEMLCLIGHGALSSFLSRQIDKQHLPSQLPWAIVSVLAQITIGKPNSGAVYNWQTQYTDVNEFLNEARLIHKDLNYNEPTNTPKIGADLAGDIKWSDIRQIMLSNRALPPPERISRSIKLTLDRLNLWTSPIFIPRAAKFLGQIRDSTERLDYVRFAVYEPLSVDQLAQLEKVRSTLKDLEKDLSGAIKPTCFFARRFRSAEYDLGRIKALEPKRKAYENALSAVTAENLPKQYDSWWEDPAPTLRLDDPGSRGHLFYHLETAAKTIASIPLIVPRGSQRETRWINQVYAERAEAVRELKNWVTIPFDCTRTDLKNKLCGILTTIANGDWGALEQRPLPATPDTPLWKRTLQITRKLFGAVAPLALVSIVDTLHPNAIDPGIRNLVIAWTGLSILALLDPGFAAKLSSFKDVKESFPGDKSGIRESKKV